MPCCCCFRNCCPPKSRQNLLGIGVKENRIEWLESLLRLAGSDRATNPPETDNPTSSVATAAHTGCQKIPASNAKKQQQQQLQHRHRHTRTHRQTNTKHTNTISIRFFPPADHEQKPFIRVPCRTDIHVNCVWAGQFKPWSVIPSSPLNPQVAQTSHKKHTRSLAHSQGMHAVKIRMQRVHTRARRTHIMHTTSTTHLQRLVVDRSLSVCVCHSKLKTLLPLPRTHPSTFTQDDNLPGLEVEW